MHLKDFSYMNTETGYRVFKLYTGENQRGREPVDAISIPADLMLEKDEI